MVLDISLNILPPNDRVIIVQFEESRNISGPRFNSFESLAAEDVGHLSMNGSDGGSSEVIMEDPE